MNSKTRLFSFVACAAFAVFVFSSASHAATMSYGDVTSGSINYTGISEESSTDPLPLFGAPTLVSDALVFTPTTFSSASNNEDSDITDSQLSLMIEVTGEGEKISKIIIEEAGDFSLAGPNARASVGSAYFVRPIQIDGQDISGNPPTLSGNVIFPQGGGINGGQFDSPLLEGSATIWDGMVTIDIDAFLASQNMTGSATKVNITLDNTLATSSVSGSSAFIKKKDAEVRINVQTEAVPEPTGIALLAIALAMLPLFKNQIG